MDTRITITNNQAIVPYNSFITIDRRIDTPVYVQIANDIIHAVHTGILPRSAKLPGTRLLSKHLGVHRNTVTAAYNELFAQGWIDIKANQGAFISSVPPSNPVLTATHSYPAHTGFTFKRSTLLDSPYEYIPCDLTFNDGVPDIRLTQINDLSRLYSANMKRKSNRKKMNYYQQEGSPYFKEQLCHYLHLSRGLPIATDNLLVTRSTEMSLYIISEIILRQGDVVVVGELSFFSANMIFQKSRCRILTVPVDEFGIDTDALRLHCQLHPIRMVYVSSHQHYPTTVGLSAARRKVLLELAGEYGFVIVEDDHDYDFYYGQTPLLPLASTDQKGMVIYVGAFGKSLAPGFRTGFIVAPADLMREMRKYLGIIDRQGDVLMEQALGEMIEEGLIQRHLNRSLKTYQERRDNLANILQQEFAAWLSFDKPDGGLAIWTVFHEQTNLMQLRQVCAQNNLFIPQTILYQNRRLTAMRVGFGHLTSDEMQAACAIMKTSLVKISDKES